MDQHLKWYRHHLLICNELYMRENFAELLVIALRVVAPHEYEIMAEER